MGFCYSGRFAVFGDFGVGFIVYMVLLVWFAIDLFLWRIECVGCLIVGYTGLGHVLECVFCGCCLGVYLNWFNSVVVLSALVY